MFLEELKLESIINYMLFSSRTIKDSNSIDNDWPPTPI